MRYTPFLDEKKIVFNSEVPDSVVNILDSCLSYIESTITWGEYKGKKRKPCPEQSVLLAGQPLGMYHCPYCGMMLLAGEPHLSPSPLGDHYEDEYGQPWPAGYEETDVSS